MPTKSVKSLHDRVEDVAFEPETDTGTPQTRTSCASHSTSSRRSGPPLVRELRFHDLLQPMYFATTVDTSSDFSRPRCSPQGQVNGSRSCSSGQDYKFLPFWRFWTKFHVTHCSVQLPILDPGLLLKGDDIVQDSSLCCFRSWVRRSLDVVANALDQESLLGAACPWVGWRWSPRCATA